MRRNFFIRGQLHHAFHAGCRFFVTHDHRFQIGQPLRIRFHAVLAFVHRRVQVRHNLPALDVGGQFVVAGLLYRFKKNLDLLRALRKFIIHHGGLNRFGQLLNPVVAFFVRGRFGDDLNHQGDDFFVPGGPLLFGKRGDRALDFRHFSHQRDNLRVGRAGRILRRGRLNKSVRQIRVVVNFGQIESPPIIVADFYQRSQRNLLRFTAAGGPVRSSAVPHRGHRILVHDQVFAV